MKLLPAWSELQTEKCGAKNSKPGKSNLFHTEEMKLKHSKGSPVKLPGQRLISSSFVVRSSSIHSKSTRKEEEDKEKCSSGNGKRVSLSDFLNRKLHKVSVPPRTVTGKERPFLSPANFKDLNRSISSENEIKSRREANPKSILDESVFRRFKHTVNDRGDFTTSCSDVHDLKKRKEPSEGDMNLPPKKKLLVIGDDPESERLVKKEKFVSKKQQPRPFYNHYANGGGWWGCDMEGIDNDEVGHTEIWEGVGSTTLGGLDWH